MNGTQENLMFESAPNATVHIGTERPPREIPLTQGRVALVDEEDYAFLSQWNWYAIGQKNYPYVIRRSEGKTIHMHRLIMNTPRGFVVDHLDHNTLNNQKANLRNCTQAQNTQNMNLSKYQGVSWNKNEKKYTSKIGFNRKLIHLGYYTDPREAALAYNKAAIKYFGEEAKLNNIYAGVRKGVVPCDD